MNLYFINHPFQKHLKIMCTHKYITCVLIKVAPPKLGNDL